jgi:drug/metabolite transporter (DMT)-like permease
MPIDEPAALGAYLCFAVAGLLAVEPSRVLGAIRFNRIRMFVISVLLLTVSWFIGGIDTLSMDVLPVLVISGLVGIFLGDTFLFEGLRRVGPRRNAVMFALNAPLTAIAGIFFLDEVLSFPVFLGCLLVTSGVMIAIAYGRRPSVSSHWEAVHGSLPLGLLFGFLAAAGQAGGILLSRPLMEQGVDPVAGSAVRVAIAALALFMTYGWTTRGTAKDHSVWTRTIILKNHRKWGDWDGRRDASGDVCTDRWRGRDCIDIEFCRPCGDVACSLGDFTGKTCAWSLDRCSDCCFRNCSDPQPRIMHSI